MKIVKDIDKNIDDDFYKSLFEIIDESDPDIVHKFFSKDKSFIKKVQSNEFIYYYFKIPIIQNISLIRNKYSEHLLENLYCWRVN